ncbi:DUF5776 domain-containing protein [Levilactobacillus suantsaii]|uniref:MucBP domain-containing protein n=1 Tax=Levilactobacillus suantsaii TaxID=2292255 RepID=A0A4V1LFJ2_9LACO|nr:DUF5776 domain-containing protein [Levilactobacillus suantsaii]QMU07839.1 MucBP domain-containing protein [Levilactobacillus suantsaii]RXI79469.1 hypothetical protein DXH47_03565 [Levilactobacillus suantsaii]
MRRWGTLLLVGMLLGSGGYVLATGHKEPCVAQAVTTTTEKQVTISRYELPYTQLVGTTGTQKLYIFPDSPQVLTAAEMADDKYLAGFSYPEGLSWEELQDIYDPFLEDDNVLKYANDENLGQFFYRYNYNGNEDEREPELTEETLIKALPLQAYETAWGISRGTEYDQGTLSFADLQAYYRQNLRPIIEEVFRIIQPDGTSLDTILGTYDWIFSTPERFETHFLPIYYTGQLVTPQGTTPEVLATLDPEKTRDLTAAILATPMRDYLHQQSNGTYQLDGLATYVVIYGLNATETPQPPVVPPIVPASQPVTVRYHDSKGKSLAPDQHLTGALGTTYRTTPKKIAGYTLKKTTGPTTGTFTTTAQTVTYQYTAASTGNTGDQVAVRGEVVSAIRRIGLYQHPTFKASQRRQWYAKKPRLQRPMFVVTGYARSNAGRLRYHVRDVNHHSQTAGQTGYVTAKATYLTPTYLQKRPKEVTVINPRGVNGYRQRNLTRKVTHYRQGQVLRVKRLVQHRLTTRLLLTNGQYVTANKRLVQTKRVSMPRYLRIKTGLNRYQDVNLTRRNRHVKAGTRLKVLGWDYSHAADFSRGSTLRYRVSGGYVTANLKWVQRIDR